MPTAQVKSQRTRKPIPDEELLDLDNQFCFALDVAARRVVKAYRPALAELGITHPQYLVLLVLCGSGRRAATLARPSRHSGSGSNSTRGRLRRS